jgi:D-aminopeptidase
MADNEMRVMIWGDMEGVACVTSWEQVGTDIAQYQAQHYRGRAGVDLVGPRTVVSTGETFVQAWRQLGTD